MLKGFMARRFEDRRLIAMLLLGFGSGLPYIVLIGTLFAWFSEAEISTAKMGVLSWAGLAYAFKFLWSPALQRSYPPFIARMGRRRGWIISFQLIITICIAAIAFLEPSRQLAWVAGLAVLGCLFSASQDIVIDAWRIEAAKGDADLDMLSANYQIAYRIAGVFGGMLALISADYMGWSLTFLWLAGLMAFCMTGALIAPEPEDKSSVQNKAGISLGQSLPVYVRNLALLAVLAGWVIAFAMIGQFMLATFTAQIPPSSRDFIRHSGPLIISLSVIIPALIAACLLWIQSVQPAHKPSALESIPPYQPVADIFYRTILEPLMDLVQRLKFGVLIVLLLVLSYRFADLIWGSFAYPFYLGNNHGALGHSLTEIAIASKTFGVLMTVAGVALGGVMLKLIGRMPSLLIGAILAAVTNLLFADLALGGTYVDAFLRITHIGLIFEHFGFSPAMARLMSAIAAENLAVGMASVAYVAFLSSIVNAKYSAVQYALLASLTMLVGTLGRGEIGERIESDGFADVFILTALLGIIAIVAVIGEWVRQYKIRHTAI